MLDNNEGRAWGNPEDFEELLGIFHNLANDVFRVTDNLDPSIEDGRQPDGLSPPYAAVSQTIVLPGSDELDLSIVLDDPQSFLGRVNAFRSANNPNLDAEIERKGFEAIAWYVPFHYLPFHERWGVYVRVDMLLDIALRFWESPLSTSSDPMQFMDVLQTVWKSILAHEYFHFQTEVFALMTEKYNTPGNPVFLKYQENVYRPNWGTSACIEEALATAKEVKSIQDANVKKFMADLARSSPGGYRDFEMCLPPRFTECQDKLYAQVAEGSLDARPRPHRAPRNRGLFSTTNVPVYLVVPVGDEADDGALEVFTKQQRRVKQNQFIKFAESYGYFVTAGGKHPTVLRGPGLSPIPIKKQKRTEPVDPYLIDELSKAIGKDKHEIREEASQM